MARPALSAARAVEVLNFLASHPEQTFTLSDLVRRLGINVASMHAILAVLEQAGYVTRDNERRGYATGPMLVPLGHAAVHRHGSIVAARAALTTLATELGVTGLVVGAAGAEMVILDEINATSAQQTSVRSSGSSVGQRIRMAAPMGGVFYAWADNDQVDAWLAAAPNGARREQAQLKRWLAAIRARGYAVGLETEARHGLRRAVRDLREEPGSRGAKSRLRSNVARLGDIATVLLEPNPQDSYDVAHIAAPVLAGDTTVLSLYLTGFRRPLSAYELERIGERLCDTARDVGRDAVSSGAATATHYDDDERPSSTLIW
jgi:DNA-binding IclR family transcriptional regulator